MGLNKCVPVQSYVQHQSLKLELSSKSILIVFPSFQNLIVKHLCDTSFLSEFHVISLTRVVKSSEYKLYEFLIIRSKYINSVDPKFWDAFKVLSRLYC